MAKYCGKDFLIQRQATVGPPATYTTIAGMRSTSLTINNESVDVTDKGDVPWRQLLQCGIRSMEMSCSGMFSDATILGQIMTDVTAGTINVFKLISGRGDTFVGAFLITSCQRSGEYNGAEQYTLSFASAGTVTYTPAA